MTFASGLGNKETTLSDKLLKDAPCYICNSLFSENVLLPALMKRIHYANTPMQYTAIFHGCKNVNFQMKNFSIFLIFAQNVDCGYTLEPPH